MKRYFLLSFVILSFAFASCSVDDSSPNEDSFDPDGIANVNNGEGVDFSKFDVVFTGEFETIGKDGNLIITDNVPDGLIDITWSSSDTSYFFVASDKTKKWKYTKTFEPPYFLKFNYGDLECKTEIYAGTFLLEKKDNNFHITMITNMKQVDYEFESIPETKETYKYLVGNGKLTFLN